MRLFSRLGLFALPWLVLCACSGVVTGSGPAAVPEQASANGASYAVPSRVLFHPLAFTPHAAQAILVDFVASGPAQGGVPCTGCVNGAGGDTIGLTGPSNLVPKHVVWQYSLAFTDVSYKGSCTLTWTIANGAKTIDTFSAKIKIPQAGGWYLFGTNRNPETYSGSATLTGQVACGSHKQSTSAPMVFQ